jgi:hypothetical protein
MPQQKPRIRSQRRVEAAIAASAAERSLEQRGDHWYSIEIATNSGSGCDGKEETARQHHRLIGFAALERLGFNRYDTHEFDWHKWPADTAEAFVAAGLADWREVLEARASRDPMAALAEAMCAQARRNLAGAR